MPVIYKRTLFYSSSILHAGMHYSEINHNDGRCVDEWFVVYGYGSAVTFTNILLLFVNMESTILRLNGTPCALYLHKLQRT